jgi:hypothetical protein
VPSPKVILDDEQFRIRLFAVPTFHNHSTLWKIVGAPLSLQLCANGSEPANDPRIERDPIHGIKSNSVPRDEVHYTFGSTCIVSRFDHLMCHLLAGPKDAQ